MFVKKDANSSRCNKYLKLYLQPCMYTEAQLSNSF